MHAVAASGDTSAEVAAAEVLGVEEWHFSFLLLVLMYTGEMFDWVNAYDFDIGS